jgi:NTP pyrophosphatase (non-canonical NTP hydrolase)
MTNDLIGDRDHLLAQVKEWQAQIRKLNAIIGAVEGSPSAGKEEERGNYPGEVPAPWQALNELGQILLHEHLIPNDFTSVPLHTELLLFISEVIEIFEDERRGIFLSSKIPPFTAIEEEVADIVLRVLSASANRGWRIGEAARAKHAYNLTRPYKHGKKL